ncbi:hypothetical protein B0I35DRAFT_122896 [Stachybotrys elegans]|uniref:Uncharacterized protein n=1 Tax=Stachybotrys elegans TaxID=80388 RepID=A0A8K0WVA4_9HYPO|nr:hypothetical protein B0I35DRAFT_122896 [Stachybotrys elegans]
MLERSAPNAPGSILPAPFHGIRIARVRLSSAYPYGGELFNLAAIRIQQIGGSQHGVVHHDMYVTWPCRASRRVGTIVIRHPSYCSSSTPTAREPSPASRVTSRCNWHPYLDNGPSLLEHLGDRHPSISISLLALPTSGLVVELSAFAGESTPTATSHSSLGSQDPLKSTQPPKAQRAHSQAGVPGGCPIRAASAERLLRPSPFTRSAPRHDIGHRGREECRAPCRTVQLRCPPVKVILGLLAPCGSTAVTSAVSSPVFLVRPIGQRRMDRFIYVMIFSASGPRMPGTRDSHHMPSLRIRTPRKRGSSRECCKQPFLQRTPSNTVCIIAVAHCRLPEKWRCSVGVTTEEREKRTRHMPQPFPPPVHVRCI